MQNEISVTRKILSWIPVIGVFIEFYRSIDKDEPLYLSDRKHLTRFFLSGIYHGVSFPITVAVAIHFFFSLFI